MRRAFSEAAADVIVPGISAHAAESVAKEVTDVGRGAGSLAPDVADATQVEAVMHETTDAL